MTELEKSLQYMVSLGIPGVSVTVLQKGKTVLRAAAGYRDKEGTVHMDGEERLNFYSMSKPITCTAAMMLAEEGKLSLSDPLWAYLPAFREMTVRTENGIKKAEREITLENLFTMSAGLNYDCASPSLKLAQKETGGECPTVKAMDYLAREPLDFEPGTRWQYSLCHDVLAAVVEVVSGERFGLFAKKRIFDPLGMTRSTFLLPEEELGTIAPQFYCDPEKGFLDCGKAIQIYKIGSLYESGGAGLVSCGEDYLRFEEGLRTGALLRRETLENMLTDRLTTMDREAYWLPDYGYGLGMRCRRAGGLYGDYGWGGAAGAYMLVDAEREMSVFFGQHVLGSPDKTHCRELVRDGAIACLEGL